MQAELLDVAQDEEGVLDDSILHDLLQVLVLDQILVDQLLSGAQRQPNDQISLERQLVNFKRSTCGFRANDLENHVFGPPQEMPFIHAAQLLAQSVRFGLFCGGGILKQAFLDDLSVLVLEGHEGAKNLRLHEVEDRP